MIIVLHASGKSFKGLMRYLGHDPQADTKERVAWTHTLNLANDLPSAAMHEMYCTFRAAEDLKRDAGVRRGGRSTETPVKHFSLSWNPEDAPGREHMVATVESFLKHMRWAEHQAVLYAHNDTAHPHVHVVLNAVHPETGLKLDEGNDWKRAERWGLAYEQERGDVRCRQRLLHPADRTPTPTRAAWEQLHAFEREDEAYEAGRDYFDRKSPEERRDRAWQALKEHQRQEREDFIAGGKAAYRDASQGAYQKVKTAFREDWREYFHAQRDGLDARSLAAMKADLLARQRQGLEEGWCEASAARRRKRDIEYAGITARHRAQGAALRDRQRQGDRPYDLFGVLYPDAAARQHAQAGNRRDGADRIAPEPNRRRTQSPTRDIWEALRAYEDRNDTPDVGPTPARYFDRHDGRRHAARERDALKLHQQEERNAFFAGGKAAFRAAYQAAREEVRAELKPEWKRYRQASAAGFDKVQLAATRAALINRQKHMLRDRSRLAGVLLRAARDKERAALRQRQKDERNELRARQQQGLRTYRLLDGIAPRDQARSGAPERHPWMRNAPPRAAECDPLKMADRYRAAAAEVSGRAPADYRAAAAQVSAISAVEKARRAYEARQKLWRQRPVLVAEITSANSLHRNAAREHATERVHKLKERQDLVRQAWRRARPGGRSYGRD